MRSNVKYTEEALREAVKTSTSFRGVIRAIGGNPNSGGMNQHIRTKIDEFGLDTSHFLGLGHRLGAVSSKRKPASVRLVKRTSGGRVKAAVLRKCLDEIGREYACEDCDISEWRGQPLTLQIDHVNGDSQDDRPENLKYRCPNCHTQTENWGSKAH